jgi:fructose-bisphosphate aldolase, class I
MSRNLKDDADHLAMTSPQIATARELVGGGKGILAADESIATIEGRLEKVGLAANEMNRRAYRQMLITTPNLAQWISGAILSDDIFRSRLSDGRPFPVACTEASLITGIKVDTGAKPLAGAPGETVTEGLDGLRDRLTFYVQNGARFAKWRAVIRIGDGIPSSRAVSANAHALARYAALAQESGLVPIVEPEVLMDGNHSLERSAQATRATLHAVFDELVEQRVLLEGIVLKTSMVVAGAQSSKQADVGTVAAATIRLLRETVPAAVPGIAFLSGGQSPELATAHLATMVALGPHPWEITFSFGRALVDPALRAWHGDADLVSAGQDALADRARANSDARLNSATFEEGSAG